jgi:hypothetical protein
MSAFAFFSERSAAYLSISFFMSVSMQGVIA